MKNMKNRIFPLLGAAVCAAALAVSCGGQDEIYKEWVKKGGYDYPAKAINLSSVSGYQNVIVNWEKPMDPAVKTATIFWDNKAYSRDIDYADYPDGKVSVNVDKLEDRSYTFEIVNYDELRNQSLAAEITVSPYGDGWLVSRSERSIKKALMSEDGQSAVIVLSKATDEMIATRFRYKNRNDEWVDCETVLKPGQDTVVFPGALKGKRFEYASSFCPAAGKDTVWNSWQRSADGISYRIDATRWNVTATNNQYNGINTPDKIIDGVTDRSAYSWHSSKSDNIKLVFPKILSIDTMAATGEEYAFTGFTFYENNSASSLRYIKNYVIYVGSKAYDPDDADYQSEGHYGIQFLSGVLSTSEAQYTVTSNSGATGRYLAIVFKDSWNAQDGFIDLWELVPYGYIPSQAD